MPTGKAIRACLNTKHWGLTWKGIRKPVCWKALDGILLIQTREVFIRSLKNVSLGNTSISTCRQQVKDAFFA